MNKQTNPFPRRSFLMGTAAVGLTTASQGWASESSQKVKNPVIFFSKHLGYMGYDALAETVAEMGFDGVDLTVRPGGHVLPGNAERDLPKATEAIRKVGLDVNMITTPVTDPHDPVDQAILKTASQLGINYYRIGTWRYDPKRDVLQQLMEWNTKLRDLAAFNKEYGLFAGYHNHSGHNQIGSTMWDIYEMMRGIDPKYVGCNWDVAHSVAEGSYGAWEINFRLLKNRIKMSAVKDCLWVKRDDGRWRMTYPPVGEGLTPWPKALSMLKNIGYDGHFSMHFEYHVQGDSETDKRKNEIAAFRRDLKRFRGYMKEAGLG